MLLQKNQLKAPLTAPIDTLKTLAASCCQIFKNIVIWLFSIDFFISKERQLARGARRNGRL